MPFYVRVPVFTKSLSYILNRNQKIGIAQWVMLNSGPLKRLKPLENHPPFESLFAASIYVFHIFHIEFRACDVDRIFHWNLTLGSWQFSSKLTPFSSGLEDAWKVCLWLLLIYVGLKKLLFHINVEPVFKFILTVLFITLEMRRYTVMC